MGEIPRYTRNPLTGLPNLCNGVIKLVAKWLGDRGMGIENDFTGATNVNVVKVFRQDGINIAITNTPSGYFFGFIWRAGQEARAIPVASNNLERTMEHAKEYVGLLARTRVWCDPDTGHIYQVLMTEAHGGEAYKIVNLLASGKGGADSYYECGEIVPFVMAEAQ